MLSISEAVLVTNSVMPTANGLTVRRRAIIGSATARMSSIAANAIRYPLPMKVHHASMTACQIQEATMYDLLPARESSS